MFSAGNVEVRLATPDDANAISALNDDVQRLHVDALPHLFKPPSADGFPPSMVLELLADPNHYFLLGRVDGEAAGYIYVEHRIQPETPSRYAMDSVYIHHISVSPPYQARGLESALMMAVKELAEARGIRTIALDVWSFNANARSFFERHGFVDYNERMWLSVGE